MRPFCVALLIASLLIPSSAFAQAAAYPLTLVVDAQAKSAVTTITSKLTIQVDRPMDDTYRGRVTDAFKHGGYPNFLNTLRTLPEIGSIQLEKRKVVIRYGREENQETGRRLILVADRPLFFLGDTKPRAGYELTLVELRIDAKGGVTGTISGAARVKPAPDGAVVLDNYAETPAQLTGVRQP
jgi:hypothetical protein